ncbi:Scopoletin glucosyltransferase [Vitis vinifera]|uniref:Scopoletin glucosyltransferase n=1 Tax=Vitis vinifera TaxID=29760 RepID=A0A438GCZ6_VITVI|nr:Scopoletin glucosyltransferase [Vitis vinifera]
MSVHIIVFPCFGQGHLLPCFELCKHLASRTFNTTLIISSNLSSSIPSDLRRIPLIHIFEISSSFPPPPPPSSPSPDSDPMSHHHRHQHQMGTAIESLLSSRSTSPDYVPPLCAIIDVMMSWSKGIFHKFNIPLVSFFTSGACSAAMEYASWKAGAFNIKPGEVLPLPGLPEDMALTYSDLQRGPHGPPGGPPGPPGSGRPPGPPDARGPPRSGPKFGGPPKPGHQPPWVVEAAGSIALMINTCDDLERPFIEYVAYETGIPVWGVGPLLPDQYWNSSGSLLHDRDIRPNRKSSCTEEEVIQWLDSKPRGSVLYVSFGSEVGPTMEGYAQLALALEASNRAFIWVIQPGSGRPGPPRPPGSDSNEDSGYYPHGLEEKVGKRGLIIRGWAPQLLILSHPSTGGFLSHCGWNSTVEATGRGVPFLAWPIRGDQYYDAMLVVKHLKIGYMVFAKDASETIVKEAIVTE